MEKWLMSTRRKSTKPFSQKPGIIIMSLKSAPVAVRSTGRGRIMKK
jgi:hypothetical protein